MNFFYLNETLGESQPLAIVVKGLESIIEGFSKLQRVDKLKIKNGWVLEKEAKRVTLAGNPLQQLVNSLDPNYKRLFYSYTTLYPLHDYYNRHKDEELLNDEYAIMEYDATNIAIVALSNGILMSLPLTDWLCRDQIQISSRKDESIQLTAHNLYGKEECNELYIVDVLLTINRQYLVGIERIKLLTLNVIIEQDFIKRFTDSPSEHKKMIVERFEEAKEKNIILPSHPNGTIVKKVEEHVYELRIVNPVDIRVYFYENKEGLYVYSMALKSEYKSKNDQTKDIERAEKALSKYCN